MTCYTRKVRGQFAGVLFSLTMRIPEIDFKSSGLATPDLPAEPSFQHANLYFLFFLSFIHFGTGPHSTALASLNSLCITSGLSLKIDHLPALEVS